MTFAKTATVVRSLRCPQRFASRFSPLLGKADSPPQQPRLTGDEVADPLVRGPGDETMLHTTRFLPLVALTAVLSHAAPSFAETVIDEWQSIKVPPPPELQAVTLDPKTTALLVIDIIKQTCNMQRRPRCVASIARVQKLLTEARTEGVYVVYALFPRPSPATFPDPKISDYVPETCAARERARRDGVRR